MNDHDQHRSTPSVGIVAELEAMCIAVDYDVTSIGTRGWGIHGHIAYDGDILAAVFPSEREAWAALLPLRPRVLASEPGATTRGRTSFRKRSS